MVDPMALNLLLNQEILTFGIFIDKCYGHNEAFVVQKMRPCFQRPWVQSLLTVGLLLNGHIWFLGIVPWHLSLLVAVANRKSGRRSPRRKAGSGSPRSTSPTTNSKMTMTTTCNVDIETRLFPGIELTPIFNSRSFSLFFSLSIFPFYVKTVLKVVFLS